MAQHFTIAPSLQIENDFPRRVPAVEVAVKFTNAIATHSSVYCSILARKRTTQRDSSARPRGSSSRPLSAIFRISCHFEESLEKMATERMKN